MFSSAGDFAALRRVVLYRVTLPTVRFGTAERQDGATTEIGGVLLLESGGGVLLESGGALRMEKGITAPK